MDNPHEDWDEYDWRDHFSKVSHEHFLNTSEGKKWKEKKQREKASENFKYFIFFVIGFFILLIIVKSGGCSSESSFEPIRR